MQLSRIFRGVLCCKVIIALGIFSSSAMAELDKDANANPKDNVSKPAVIELDTVEVKANRIRIITPLPGMVIDRAQSTTNIQSASGKAVAESKALNVTEFMNSEMQSVSINDYAGNPFQQDLNFRGFTASPSIGTPQGIAVYMDGVRVNEPFGDVVNWDLIPMNAIQSIDLIPGSNPLFGLNALGGSLAIRTKNGFTDQHARGQFLMGDWGRKQTQVSNGINNGTLGFFTAYNQFEEDGWRKNSPSDLKQLFNVATVKLPFGELNLSALNIQSNLLGNGMLPTEMAQVDRTGVFTSPDQVRTSLNHYNMNFRWDVSDVTTVSAMMYKRNVNQSVVSGDIFEAYKGLISKFDPFDDANGDGKLDTDILKLNGMFNFGQLKQNAKGYALQASFDFEKHQLVTGLSYDKANIKFFQSQTLAEIDDNHTVNFTNSPLFAYDPLIDGYYFMNGVETTSPGIIRNDLVGHSTTKSLFFMDTWSPIDTLHVTFGGRFNWTNVFNNLRSDRGKDLYNFEAVNFLPENQVCRKNSKDAFSRFVCTTGDFNYRSFNPSIGVAWEAKQNLTVYSNVSRGARTPTVIELGCAKDHTLESNTNNSTNTQYGCSIPTALSADPYLKQVRSTSYEMGLRGTDYGFDWNLGVFRTELKDDILFVPLGRKNRGVFDNFGETLRQGMEFGVKGELGKSRLSLNYSYLQATFESPAQLVNESNSSNTAVQTIQSYVNVKPGDSIPGLPNHIVQASWNYKMTDRFDFTLNMVMHSSSYVRGNENNEHQARSATNATSSDGTNRDAFDYLGSGKVSGYAVFNLRANYKWDHGIGFFLKMDNLFDKDYATAGDLGKTPFTASGAFISNPDAWNKTTFIGPGAPRALWIGVNYDLDWAKLKSK